ncbi:MAG TPA: hypothetical protein VMV96_06060 [Acidimicrobiales bacterium]|nr:hypothetical protein [Acidimicrobiales bacterium]
MRRTHVILSWVLTSALTVVSAVGIVALTTGNLVSTAATTAPAATTASTAAAAPAHGASYTVSYRGDSNESGD